MNEDAKGDPDTLLRITCAAQSIEQQALHDPYESGLVEALDAALQPLASIEWSPSEQVAHAQYAAGLACYALRQREASVRWLSVAVDRYVELAEADPQRYQPRVVHCRTRLAKPLIELERNSDGLAEAKKAAEWLRANMDDEACRCDPDLAQALHSMGLANAKLGDLKAALAFTEEALCIRRRLAERDPANGLAGLWVSLNNRSNWLERLGRRAEALAGRQEAVEVAELAAEDGHVPSRVNLAASLRSFGSMLSKLGRFDEALRATTKAVAQYSELVRANPAACVTDLAVALIHLSDLHCVMGRHLDALQTAEESLQLFGELPETDRDTHVPQLASTMARIGLKLIESNLSDKGIGALQVASQLNCHHAVALTKESLSLRQSGNRAGAVDTARRSVSLLKMLPADPLIQAGERFRRVALLAAGLTNLAALLRDDGQQAEALQVDEDAAQHLRTLHEATRTQESGLWLAQLLNNIGCKRDDSGDKVGALAAATEAVSLCRRFIGANPSRFKPELARCLANQGNYLEGVSEAQAALNLSLEAFDLFRDLAQNQPTEYEPSAAKCQSSVGMRQLQLGDLESALSTQEAALIRFRRLARVTPRKFAADLAKALMQVANCHAEMGQGQRAASAALEARDVGLGVTTDEVEELLPRLAACLTKVQDVCYRRNRELDATRVGVAAMSVLRRVAAHRTGERMEVLAGIADRLSGLGKRLEDLGHFEEAVVADKEAVEVLRDLVKKDRVRHLRRLAVALEDLAHRYDSLGRDELAYERTHEAVQLFRDVGGGGERMVDLAMGLGNLGTRAFGLARYADGIRFQTEAIGLFQELVTVDPHRYRFDYAISLNNFGNNLAGAGSLTEALVHQRKSIEVLRTLPPTDLKVRSALAGSLNGLAGTLVQLKRYDEAIEPGREALEMLRKLDLNDLQTLEWLGKCMLNLASLLDGVGEHRKALQLWREAVDVHDRLSRMSGDKFGSAFAKTLSDLALRQASADQGKEAIETWRRLGKFVLQWRTSHTASWAERARSVSRHLDTPLDLRDYYVPLVQTLTRRRELAESASPVDWHLQADVSARIWDLILALPEDAEALREECIALVVSSAQSFDLARWLSEVGGATSSHAATLRLELVEAAQFYDALRLQLQDADDGYFLRSCPPDLRESLLPGGLWPVVVSSRNMNRILSLNSRLGEQSVKVKKLQIDLQAELRSLAMTDPIFEVSSELTDMAEVRAAASFADASALLCMLELPTRMGDPRVVGALVHADGTATEMLEFPGLRSVVADLIAYEPSVDCDRGVTLRDAYRASGQVNPPETSRTDGSSLPSQSPISELLGRCSQSFWSVLQDACARALQRGGPLNRVHICSHGILQAMPLGLRGDQDCRGLEVIAWPGLPYLRLAAKSVGTQASMQETAPWLVGADCAWGSEMPLPMTAVEGALLRDLLQTHGLTTQPVSLKCDQVMGQSAAFVLCCHARRAEGGEPNFGSALMFGRRTLSARSIARQSRGPSLALLPACHAAETRSDGAGNAIGIGAAFLLSGTRTVIASAKTVFDRLMPIYSTLTAWHIVENRMSAWKAAVTAREQLAACKFPEGYCLWLASALPAALEALYRESMEELESARRSQRPAHEDAVWQALDSLVDQWPWQGTVGDLFSPDSSLRRAAAESAARNVLLPRSDIEAKLRQQMRTMAAFIVVYGVE